MKPAKIVRNKFLRAKVFERDGGVCATCGRFDPKWQHDHILPLSLGGKDTLDNAQTLCRDHHGAKTSAEAAPRAKADRLSERHKLTEKRRAVSEIRLRAIGPALSAAPTKE
jgi:5-methylcytosine-specific restriction endonuclease McrA